MHLKDPMTERALLSWGVSTGRAPFSPARKGRSLGGSCSATVILEKARSLMPSLTLARPQLEVSVDVVRVAQLLALCSSQ
eukprot:5383379-Amphidinium_carterae.1